MGNSQFASAHPPGWVACGGLGGRVLDVTTGATIQTSGGPALRPLRRPDAELRAADIITPGFIRRRTGRSQTGFARTRRIPIATSRNAEQHRVAMDPATIALMTILARAA